MKYYEGLIINNKRIIDLDKTDNSGKKYYNIECLKCHSVFSQRQDHIQDRCGCPTCKTLRGRKPKDLFGFENDFIKVVSPLNKKSKNGYLWKCQCKQCKNFFQVAVGNINNTKSCGCVKSHGEKQISEILSQKKVYFETQKTFNTCRFEDTNALARFDFYLPDYNTIIEYDGIQHFSYTNKGWNTKYNFDYTQKHDLYKNSWCKKNNIQLFRISYKDFDKIEEILNDILK